MNPAPLDPDAGQEFSVRAAPRSLMPSQRCSAKSSRTGKACGRYAITGGTVCPTHGGSAPQVRRAAQERIAALVPLALDTLAEVAGTGDNEAARVRAAAEILKHAGVQAPSEKDELLAGNPNPDLDALIEQALRSRMN